MEIVVDPEIQAQFDANLATYRARTEQVGETLKAEQQQIAEQSKAADEKFAAEQAEALSKVKEEFKDTGEGAQPPRSVGWNPVEGDGDRDENVMRFGTEPDDAEDRRPARRPAGRPRPARQAEEDDYSEQSWLRD